MATTTRKRHVCMTCGKDAPRIETTPGRFIWAAFCNSECANTQQARA